MVAKFFAGISIAVIVMRVVVSLEQAMLLDDPRDLGTHIGPDDPGGNFRVVVRRQIVAYVMNERGDDEFVIRTILERTRRGLQGVSQPAHGISLQRMIQFRSAASRRSGNDWTYSRSARSSSA